MDTTLNQLITRLATGEIIRVDNAHGQSVVIVKGMVWITQEGDPRDVFLTDGENFVFDKPGTALVQAVTDTSLIALVGEAAEVIEAASAPVATRAHHEPRGLAAYARLHRNFAARLLNRMPAHQLA